MSNRSRIAGPLANFWQKELTAANMGSGSWLSGEKSDISTVPGENTISIAVSGLTPALPSCPDRKSYTRSCLATIANCQLYLRSTSTADI